MENKQLLAEKLEVLSKAITVTCELTDTAWREEIKAEVVAELMSFDTQMVLNALSRCRRELTGRLTLAAILQRMDCGLPSADEAFGLLSEGLKNEHLTVVVPEIALLAMGQGAQALLDLGDKTGARMAFRGAYERMAEALKVRGEMGQWTVSAGLDKQQMAAAVQEAVRLGRLPAQQALLLLPSGAEAVRHELETGEPLRLECKQQGQQQVAKLLETLSVSMAMPKPFEKRRHEARADFEAKRAAALAMVSAR